MTRRATPLFLLLFVWQSVSTQLPIAHASETDAPEESRPGFTVVDYVTLPDGPQGLPERDPVLSKIAKPVARALPWAGPFDGMVESGSQVLVCTPGAFRRTHEVSYGPEEPESTDRRRP